MRLALSGLPLGRISQPEPIGVSRSRNKPSQCLTFRLSFSVDSNTELSAPPSSRSLFDDPDELSHPAPRTPPAPSSWRSVHNMTMTLTDNVGLHAVDEGSLRASVAHEVTISYGHQRTTGLSSHGSKVFMREQMHNDQTDLRAVFDSTSSSSSEDRRTALVYAQPLSKDIIRRVIETESLLAQRCADCSYPFVAGRNRRCPVHSLLASHSPSKVLHQRIPIVAAWHHFTLNH